MANKADTVSAKDLAAEIAEKHNISKKQSEEIVNDLTVSMTNSLKKGSVIRLSGFGVLQVRERAARTGRNPHTGETIQIKPSKKIAFRALKDLREAV